MKLETIRLPMSCSFFVLFCFFFYLTTSSPGRFSLALPPGDEVVYLRYFFFSKGNKGEIKIT